LNIQVILRFYAMLLDAVSTVLKDAVAIVAQASTPAGGADAALKGCAT
jgi:hypothetical protein